MMPDSTQIRYRSVSLKFSGSVPLSAERSRKTCLHPGQQKRSISSPMSSSLFERPRGSPQRSHVSFGAPVSRKERISSLREMGADSGKIFYSFNQENTSHGKRVWP